MITAHIIIALQEIHAKELSFMDESVLTIGSIHEGNMVVKKCPNEMR